MFRGALLAMSRSRRLDEALTTSRLAWRAASRFVAGETLAETLEVARSLNAAGLSATLDHLGENVSTVAEAEAARSAYVEATDRIRAAGVHSGISLKLTALGLDVSTDVAESLLREVAGHAAGLTPPVFVRIDMEGSAYTERTLEIFHRVHAGLPNVGAVIQSMLRRSDADVRRLVAAGAGVRLVKGAYLEPPAVAYAEKADVDAAFRRLAALLMSPEARARGVYAAIATHDEAILGWAKRHAAEEGLGPDDFECQMLFGVRRDLQAAVVAEGYRMRVYVPYGRAWYPYFMRRLAERPENLAFVLRNVLREMGP